MKDEIFRFHSFDDQKHQQIFLLSLRNRRGYDWWIYKIRNRTLILVHSSRHSLRKSLLSKINHFVPCILIPSLALGIINCSTRLSSVPHHHNLTDLHFYSFSLCLGVGIVLVTISGVAWRMTIYDSHQCTGRCGRRQCSRGNSSFGLLYPEFQHRPPPPSYQASMQEYRLR